MPLPVKLEDVIEALEGAGDENTYYLDKRTGEIVSITDQDMRAAEEDQLISEYPEWQRETILKARELLSSDADFTELPDRFEINEYQMMEDFCLSLKNRRVGDELRRLIKGGGAFRRFKNAVNSMGVDKAWYAFRQRKFDRIAIEWLEEEGIPYTRADESENLDQEL
jgi:hypothetical protein